MKKTTSYLVAIIALTSTAIFAQKDKCNCFNKEEYTAFVKAEQHQTVIEGNDAELTVLLSKVLKEDITVTYEVIGNSANIEDDLTVPNQRTFTIPKGEKQATIHIPTNNDGIRELDETFTIKIIKGITANSKKSLNNNNLVRTRTIIDSDSNTLNTSFYLENGVVKTNADISSLEVRNVNGVKIANQNITTGNTYFIKAVGNHATISKTIIFK